MSSSIGPARAALYTLLAAAAADNTNPLYGVQVTFGNPDQYDDQEIVSLLGIETPTEIAWVVGEQAPREERYAIRIAVKCEGPEDDAATVDARGWVMHQAVRQVLIDNVRLSDTVFQQFPGPVEPTPGAIRVPTNDGKSFLPGWAIRIEQTSNCLAFI